MRKTISQEQNNERGITLIALVVTIIVLMILAGITLGLVLGQNGIISKAKEAKKASANAYKSTEDGLNNLYDDMSLETGETAPTTIAVAIEKKWSAIDNTPIKDDEGNTITVPAGFHIASDSAIKQEDGIVIEDADGNQFVWIPVANIANYVRASFGKDASSYSAYSETMPSDEQTSVSIYHGYYIGRYETGDNVSTTNKTLRTSQSGITNKLAIKKGEAPYNYVTVGQAKILSEGMKTDEKYKATTKLCSSYAWDTAINFIQNKVSDYGTSSSQGNYTDTTFNYIDITGASKTKALDKSVVIPTGQTTPVCNIYDMGGNELEWITETSTSMYTCVHRGGCYANDHIKSAAGYRANTFGTTDYDDLLGFRTTLYL